MRDLTALSRGRDTREKLRRQFADDQCIALVRAFQGHSLPIKHPRDRAWALTLRFLIRAANMQSAQKMLTQGMKLMENRIDLHFAEWLNFRRKSAYLQGCQRQEVFLVSDRDLAQRQGYQFIKRGNGAVVSPGAQGRMSKDVFVSAWRSDCPCFSLPALVSGHPTTQVCPVPEETFAPRSVDGVAFLRDSSRCLNLQRIRGRKRSRPLSFPAMSPPAIPQEVPKPPTPSLLDAPEIDRPPSGYPCDRPRRARKLRKIPRYETNTHVVAPHGAQTSEIATMRREDLTKKISESPQYGIERRVCAPSLSPMSDAAQRAISFKASAPASSDLRYGPVVPL